MVIVMGARPGHAGVAGRGPVAVGSGGVTGEVPVDVVEP